MTLFAGAWRVIWRCHCTFWSWGIPSPGARWGLSEPGFIPSCSTPAMRLDLARCFAIRGWNPGQACRAPPLPGLGAPPRGLPGTDRQTHGQTDGKTVLMAMQREPSVGPEVSVPRPPHAPFPSLIDLSGGIVLGKGDTPKLLGRMNSRGGRPL